MSRNSILVAFGCLWTFGSVLQITDMAVAAPDLLTLAAPLAVGLTLSAAYWRACALADANCLRSTANFLHIAVSVLWVSWMVSLHQTSLTPNQAVLIVFNMALGAALADMGSFGDSQTARRRASASLDDTYTMRPLTAYDSGRFAAPQLSACDSGSFPRP